MTAMDEIGDLAVDDKIRTDDVNMNLFLSHFEGFLSDGMKVSGWSFKKEDRQQSW